MFIKNKLYNYKHYIEMEYEKSFIKQELTEYSKDLLKSVFPHNLLQKAKNIIYKNTNKTNN